MSLVSCSNHLSKIHPLECSSLLFLIPAYVGVNKMVTQPYSLLYVVTTLFSLNHWRDPLCEKKRNMDRIIARVSFVITLFTGLRVVRDYYTFILGIYLAVCIVLAYSISRYLGRMNNKWWYIAHVLMHIFVSSGMTLVVFNVQQAL